MYHQIVTNLLHTVVACDTLGVNKLPLFFNRNLRGKRVSDEVDWSGVIPNRLQSSLEGVAE